MPLSLEKKVFEPEDGGKKSPRDGWKLSTNMSEGNFSEETYFVSACNGPIALTSEYKFHTTVFCVRVWLS
jgi:hypothetical protein